MLFVRASLASIEPLPSSGAVETKIIKHVAVEAAETSQCEFDYPLTVSAWLYYNLYTNYSKGLEDPVLWGSRSSPPPPSRDSCPYRCWFSADGGLGVSSHTAAVGRSMDGTTRGVLHHQ